MKRLLVEGWRGLNHSFAMVNQHQLLALARLGRYELHHRDMPLWNPAWNQTDNGAGLSEPNARLIAGLADLPTGQADVLQIPWQYRLPPALNRRPCTSQTY